MNLITERLTLIPCSVEMLQSLIDEDIDLTELIGVQVPEGWPAEKLKEVAPYFIKLLSESPDMAGKLCRLIIEKEQDIVVGFGKAVLLEDVGQKRKALDIIMQKFSKDTFEYSADAIENTVVIKVEIESMTGKQSG